MYNVVTERNGNGPGSPGDLPARATSTCTCIICTHIQRVLGVCVRVSLRVHSRSALYNLHMYIYRGKTLMRVRACILTISSSTMFPCACVLGPNGGNLVASAEKKRHSPHCNIWNINGTVFTNSVRPTPSDRCHHPGSVLSPQHSPSHPPPWNGGEITRVRSLI